MNLCVSDREECERGVGSGVNGTILSDAVYSVTRQIHYSHMVGQHKSRVPSESIRESGSGEGVDDYSSAVRYTYQGTPVSLLCIYILRQVTGPFPVSPVPTLAGEVV